MAHDPRVGERASTLRRMHHGVIGFCSGQNSFLESNAVFVLTGFRPMGESAILLHNDGTARLVVTPAWDAARATAQTRLGAVIATDDLAEGIGRAINELMLDTSQCVTVGLNLLGRALVQRIEGKLGTRAASADGLLRELARIRAPVELQAARRATWIAEQGYQRLLAVARPGMREYELAADIYCHMKGLGSEDNFLLMSASQHNHAVRAAGQRVLDVGDIILGEITPCVDGQFAQICRTAVIGKPRPVVAEKYTLLQAAMRRGQEIAVPGTTVSEVTQAMNEVIAAGGYGDYCRPPYMRVRGHGLGITSSLPGDIEVENQTVLEEGMVFVMHPNQYIPESGYLLCGDTVVITPRGAEGLSENFPELDIIEV